MLYKNQTSHKKALALLLCGIVVVGVCQGVKWDYRQVHHDTFRDKIEHFVTLGANWIRRDMLTLLSREEFIERFNQGWHINQVVLYMDATGNYLYGESIFDSLLSSFVPRYLDSEKRKSGGRKNIEEMTWLRLTELTSMNVSYVGEGYGNWGKWGAWLFPGCVGVLFGLGLRLVLRFAKKYRETYFFIPVIFFYTLRAESDFLTAFNQYVKLLLITAALLWFFDKISKKEHRAPRLSETSPRYSAH